MCAIQEYLTRVANGERPPEGLSADWISLCVECGQSVGAQGSDTHVDLRVGGDKMLVPSRCSVYPNGFGVHVDRAVVLGELIQQSPVSAE